MLPYSEAGWTVLTHNAVITTDPAYLCCITLSVVDSGDYIEIYDGQDTSSGRKVLKLEALANRSANFNFTVKIPCRNGLYISFSTDDSEATVVWMPMKCENEVKDETP